MLACAICLVVGGLVGRLIFPAEQSQGDDKMAARESESITTRSNARPRSGLGAGNRGEAPSSDDTDPAREQNVVTVPTPLIEALSLSTGTRTLGQALFSGDGKVEELLQITDQEKAAVQTAWRLVREKVRALEVSSSTAVDLEDGSVRITIPDLASGMGDVNEGIKSSVKNTLGENRGDIFLAVKQVDRILAAPKGERTYGVAVEPIGDGRLRYRMTLEGPAGRRVWVSESIPDEIRHLTDAAKIMPKLQESTDEEEDSN